MREPLIVRYRGLWLALCGLWIIWTALTSVTKIVEGDIFGASVFSTMCALFAIVRQFIKENT